MLFELPARTERPISLWRIPMATAPLSTSPEQTRPDAIDAELETILTSFDTSYAWNY